MEITSVRVGNFRAIGNTVTLDLGDMTALIGSNGTGKTTLLLAIERFFSDKNGIMSVDDFNDRARPLEITVVVDGGTDRCKEITRKWACKAEKEKTSVTAPKYHCGEDAKPGYAAFLGCAARVLYVPTEHETDEDGEGKKNTILQKLISDAVRHKMTKKARGEERARRIDFQDGYKGELKHAEKTLNQKLGSDGGVGYAPNARVTLDFGEPEVGLKARMSIDDRDGDREGSHCNYGVDHGSLGHGTRRAFYMAAIEADAEILAGSGARDGGATDGALTLCIIDEPELHQHPQRQALIFDALRRLSEEPSSQVIYATHSPHFVSLGAQMDICRVSRTGAEIGVRGTAGTKGMSVSEGVARPIGEAIFSNGAILVEGLHDEAIMRVVLRATPHGGGTLMSVLAGREVAVVNCLSKYNIEHYYRILDALGVACFVVWDGDMDVGKDPGLDQAKKTNRRLLRMAGADPGRAAEIEGAGSDDCIVGDGWACFGHNLPAYFSKYFELEPRRLKGMIRDGADIAQRLDRERLFQSEFYKRALPSMRRTLIE